MNFAQINQAIKNVQSRFSSRKIYRALLSQAGTANPTAIVLENDFAPYTIAWARTGVGIYTATLTNAFTNNKTFIRGQLIDIATNKSLRGTRTSANVLTFNTGVNGGALADALLSNTEVEIIVFT
jgi:hypothetical protein